MLHISLAAEKLFIFFGIPITNSIIMTWLVMAFLAVASYFLTRNLTLLPSRTQTVLESIVGGLYGFFKSLLGAHTDYLFPLIASFFIFIITSNWMGLLPGVGTIGIYEQKIETHAANPQVNPDQTPHKQVKQESPPQADVQPDIEHAQDQASTDSISNSAAKVHEDPDKQNGHGDAHPVFVPFLRAPTADLNMTLALGIIAFIAIQFYGFKVSGPAYGKKFINFTNPIYAFVGFLEIISDISKIISFAFRLFGNIFAGEVLLGVIAYIVASFVRIPLLVPIPFLFLEIFVGFIQALVFAMLVSVFINIAASHAHGSEHHQ